MQSSGLVSDILSSVRQQACALARNKYLLRLFGYPHRAKQRYLALLQKPLLHNIWSVLIHYTSLSARKAQSRISIGHPPRLDLKVPIRKSRLSSTPNFLYYAVEKSFIKHPDSKSLNPRGNPKRPLHLAKKTTEILPGAFASAPGDCSAEALETTPASNRSAFCYIRH